MSEIHCCWYLIDSCWASNADVVAGSVHSRFDTSICYCCCWCQGHKSPANTSADYALRTFFLALLVSNWSRSMSARAWAGLTGADLPDGVRRTANLSFIAPNSCDTWLWTTGSTWAYTQTHYCFPTHLHYTPHMVCVAVCALTLRYCILLPCKIVLY